MVFLLFSLLLIPSSVSTQPFISPGLSKLVSTYLGFAGISLQTKLSPQCALDNAVFIRSLSKSLRILEKCNNSSCLGELSEHMFALKQLDAFGKIPSGISQWTTTSEGSWATCKEVDGEKYETDYCYLMIVPGKNSTCPKFQDDPYAVIKLKLGVCVPTSCDSRDVVAMFHAVSSLPVTACETFCVKPSEKYLGFWFWIFVLFMVSMFCLAAVATFMDYYFVDSEDKEFRFRALCCFSLISNFKLICKPRKEIMGVHLRGLDFLRFSSVFWVILGHSPVNYLFGDNMKAIIDTKHHLWNHLMLDAPYAIETFLMITGTLMGFAIFNNLNSSNVIRSKTFWLKMLARRYYRLMPALVTWMGVMTFSAQFLRGSTMASFFNNHDHQAKNCYSHWWINLFMVQNYWKPMDNCFPVSWYSAFDFQVLILSSFIVVPLVRSQTDGLRTAAFLTVLSVAGNFLIFWFHNLTPFHYATRGMENFFVHAHQQSFTRIPTLIMAILLGRTLALHKYPVQVLRDHSGKCWILAGVLFYLCLYGKLLAVVQIGEEEMNPLLAAAHHMALRVLFSFVIFWVIYACQHDLGHPVTSLLSSPIWQPFGRLTYCTYLIHWWMIYVVMNFSDRPLRFISVVQVILQTSIPTVVLTVPTALIWSSMFEVPVTRLEKLFLRK